MEIIGTLMFAAAVSDFLGYIAALGLISYAFTKLRSKDSDLAVAAAILAIACVSL